MRSSFRAAILCVVVVLTLLAVTVPASAATSCTAHLMTVGSVSAPGLCVASTPKCAQHECGWDFYLTVSATFPTSRGGAVFGDMASVTRPTPGFVNRECEAKAHATSASCTDFFGTLIIGKGDQLQTACVVRPWPVNARVKKATATCRLVRG